MCKSLFCLMSVYRGVTIVTGPYPFLVFFLSRFCYPALYRTLLHFGRFSSHANVLFIRTLLFV